MDSSRKYGKIRIGLAIAAALLLGRLFYIQIVNSKYKTDALNNSIVYETIYPPRGVIYDRGGEVLVGNKATYDILVTPREVSAFDTLGLARVLGVDAEFIRERMAYYKSYRTRIGFKTLVFLKHVDEDAYMRFSEVEYRFPGFRGQIRTERMYPFNAGGNLLGYVSEVDADYIRKHPEYKSGDNVGRTGLEAAREEELRGEKGYHIYLRDSRNRVLTAYNEGADDKLAVPGRDIVTTIDAHLQQYGQELMSGRTGSLIAIEPSTGEILALVSSPGIDVDVLTDMGSHFDELTRDPGKPLFNRAVQASYPPGSVFKLVCGLIGMQEGVLTPRTQYGCSRGYVYAPGKKLGCHEHRSPLNFTEAVRMSCNSYFCNVFKNVLENRRYESTAEAFDQWESYVRAFGFGSKLGTDYPGELGGTIPTSAYYDKIYGRGHWKHSSIVSLSIGQGEIGATPLQIANLAAILANRGWYYTPHMLADTPADERHETGIDPRYFEYTVEGMWQAVNMTVADGSTATLARVRGLDICGKTGTAQNPHGDDHSVFICFAPREDPQIAVAAYVENGGWGGSTAAPIASLLIERYLNGEISPERKWLREWIKVKE
ncbi:MAG: penicillin-binding protein 2 [Bacteroidales bacterium]|nr:penicillin-binding protein 2 [Bacteroidales bacterium]